MNLKHLVIEESRLLSETPGGVSKVQEAKLTRLPSEEQSKPKISGLTSYHNIDYSD